MKIMIINKKILTFMHKKLPNFELLKDIDFEFSEQNFDFKNTKLHLDHINAFEIILNEDLWANKKNFVKMFNKHKPTHYMVSNDINTIDMRLEEILSSSSLNSWSRLGIVQFNNNKTLTKYVKFIEISLITVSGSFSIISFDIHIDNAVTSELERDLLNNISSLSYKGRIRTSELFKIKRIMPGGEISNEDTKRIRVEDIVTEIKTECINEVQKYINLYFNENNVCAPSFNAFSTNISHTDNRIVAKHIFSSIGINNSEGELRKDGSWALFINKEQIYNTKRFNNYSIIFSDDYQDEFNRNYRDYIDSKMIHIGFQYFHVPVYRTFIQFYENILTINKSDFFSKIKGQEFKLSSWIKLKMQIDKYDIVFNRMYETVNNIYFQNQINGESMNFVDFNTRFRKGSLLNNYWNNTVDLYKTIEIRKNIIKIDIESYINSITTKSNLQYNSKSIWLMIITAFISLLSVIIAFYSVLIATGII